MALSMSNTGSSAGGVPFLPGYRVPEPKDSFSKKQTLGSAGAGIAGTLKTGMHLPKLDLASLQALADPTHRYSQTSRPLTHEERETIKDSARNTYRPAISPAWLKHDRQVLRFFAVHEEPLAEQNESSRLRNYIFYFYLEDGTMMVQEPKVRNSGIPQGTFFKRHRIPRPQEMGGGHFTCEDLRVGASLVIYCRTFQLIDCDEFTRDFYQRVLNVTLDPAIELPEPEQPKTARNPVKVPKLASNRRTENVRQYLENDRKVLRFHCYWDDHTKYGSRMYMTLHYYLADDSVELLTSFPRNWGGDSYPTFYKRSPLRMNPYVSPAPGMLEPESIIYKPEDFIIGKTVNVWGRQLFLYDCDDFTRDFYVKYMDHPQEKIVIETPPTVHTKLCPPPYRGMGSEEDSMESCVRLTPRPQPPDVERMMKNTGKALRFEAVMANGKMEDENRRFIAAIYLADDAVAVWGMKTRNSGHAEGKFAQRSRKRNPATGDWFKAADFYIGAKLEINCTPFLLTQADEGALIHMEAHPLQFPYSDPVAVQAKLYDVKELLTQVPEISAESFKELCKGKGINLVEQEVVTLLRKFGNEAGLLQTAPLLQEL